MDLFLIQVDGLDVAITDNERFAVEHAERIAAEATSSAVHVVRLKEGSLEILPRIPAAEAVTSADEN